MNTRYIYNKITGYYHRDHSKLYITVRRDWNILLISLFFFFLFSFAYNYYVYIETVVYADASISSENPIEKNSDIEEFKKELDEIFVYFENKKQYHQNLLEERRDFINFISDNEKTILEGENPPSSDTEEEKNKTSFLDVFQANVSNMATVWKSIFIDLFK